MLEDIQVGDRNSWTQISEKENRLDTYENERLPEIYQFQLFLHKREHDRWAYTVLFSFPQDTLRYFDEGEYAVVTKRFYKSLLRLYVELVYPEIELESRGKEVKELENDKELYGEFLQWANSSENIEKKKQLYINDL